PHPCSPSGPPLSWQSVGLRPIIIKPLAFCGLCSLTPSIPASLPSSHSLSLSLFLSLALSPLRVVELSRSGLVPPFMSDVGVPPACPPPSLLAPHLTPAWAI